jgi:ribosomal protein S18 acetylase RimI-like enzyme
MSDGRLRVMTSFSLAPLEDHDLVFVHEMLYEAAFWRSADDRPPLDTALSSPDLALYIRDWGRQGDDGLIARVDDHRAGAVWVRRFHAGEHGYGYVDQRTPELSIAVAAHRRGYGIGRCLVAAMLVQLRLQGTRQVSLSVEIDNPALLLYESLGFISVTTGEGAVTLVRNLA